MNLFFRKTILSVLVAVLTLAALPVTSVFAQEENPPREVTDGQLEKAWAHQLKIYEGLVRVFEEGDVHLAKAQELIDKATAKGRDTSAVQAALNAFSAAVEKSTPMYNEVDALITTHAGFDANGKVTDAAQARATVQAVRTALKELKTSMNGTGKALRDAIKAFREANKPAEENKIEKDS